MKLARSCWRNRRDINIKSKIDDTLRLENGRLFSREERNRRFFEVVY